MDLFEFTQTFWKKFKFENGKTGNKDGKTAIGTYLKHQNHFSWGLRPRGQNVFNSFNF